MGKHNEVEVDEVVHGLAEYSKEWVSFQPTLSKLDKFVKGLRASVVQASNDLISKRAEVASAKADLEKIRKECEIRLAAVNSTHQDLVNQITKERMEIAAEKRRLEFVASELNRKAVGV